MKNASRGSNTILGTFCVQYLFVKFHAGIPFVKL